MRKQDALKVKAGDYIHLKHGLGGGKVLKLLKEPVSGILGSYPMIWFEDDGVEKCCTYIVVDVHTAMKGGCNEQT